MRFPQGGESVLLWTMNTKPEDQLLQDPGIGPWIRSYTLAWCKMMLGEAYSKFPTIAGPQGGTTLKGEPLKAEAKAMFDQLERELDLFVDWSSPPGIVIG